VRHNQKPWIVIIGIHPNKAPGLKWVFCRLPLHDGSKVNETVFPLRWIYSPGTAKSAHPARYYPGRHGATCLQPPNQEDPEAL
jgi:hypothetical protein